jgi:hypothetical protein
MCNDAYGSLYDKYIHDSRMWFDLGNSRTIYNPNDAVRNNVPQNQF